jgi:hypothetical protein
MLFHKNLFDAVRDCVTRGVDDFGQSGLTDGHSWGGVDGRSGNRKGVRGNGIAGVRKWSSSEAKYLALSTDGLGGGEFNGKFHLGSGHLGGVLDWGWKSDSGGNSGLGSGDSGGVIGLGSGHFGCVFNLDGRYRIVDGSDGQVVGLDVEASGVGGVGDTDFLAFRIDVSVAADLVAEPVTEVAGGLSGVSV